ncbi:hypothetical protein GE061_017705 [Apolygus lucorum]|uniref:Major facilitator superfamily (MFS) profile domain-containing protein n=1 Tax=Apolygus lucorum TaxID=248454 RepID=A0A6A4J3P5_APOLU|nr:hypothetical protein GE061_017705 [Apolygus lucorum]
MESSELAPKPPGMIGTRHRQVFLMFIGLVLAYSMRVNLSVGVVAMTDPTVNSAYPTVNWTTAEKGVVSSMFFYGYFLTGIPAGMLASRYGPIKVVGWVGGILCGAASVAFPFAVHFGFYWACALRVLQGLGQGFFYPCVNTHMSKWAIPEERGRLFSSCFSGTQLGTILMLGLGGFLATGPGGWYSIFYGSGGLSIIWGIACLVFGADSPAEHSTISTEERAYIETHFKASSSESKKMKIPWLSISLSVPMWSLLLVHLAQNWGFWTLLTLMPTYMKGVLNFDIQKNGTLSALPYLVMFINAIIFAHIADYITSHKLLTVNFARKMWNSIALYGGAAALLSLATLSTDSTGAIILLTVTVGLNAACYNGYLCNHLDLSPNFAGILMGITNGLSNITSILAPTIAGILVKDESSVEEWQTVFLASSAVFFVGNSVFVAFGSTQIQKWNDPDCKKDEGKNGPI